MKKMVNGKPTVEPGDFNRLGIPENRMIQLGDLEILVASSRALGFPPEAVFVVDEESGYFGVEV